MPGSSSTAAESSGTTIRKSQRAPTRCQRCAQKRIRCDGRIPCSSCVKRGNAHMCRRETVMVKGRLIGGEADLSTTGFDALSKEEIWAQLKAVTAELQAVRAGGEAGGVQAQLKGASPSAFTNTPHLSTPHRGSTFTPNSDLSQMALKLGLIPDHSSRRYTGQLDADEPGSLTSFPNNLPPVPYHLIQQLLDFAFDELGWLICPVPSSFKDQVAAVQSGENAGEVVDFPRLVQCRPSWTALCLAIVSAALVYIPASRSAQLGVPVEQKRVLAGVWFRASLNTLLTAAGCLVKPRLAHLQTFCVLTLLFQPFDCMALHDILLGAMLQAALRLNLQHLRKSPEERTCAGEIGRRVWAFLLSREVHYTSEDYCASVSRLEPEPFATFLNISEPDTSDPLVGLALSEPTRVSYLLAGSRVTAFTCRLQNLPVDIPYEEILKLDGELNGLLDDMAWTGDGDSDRYPAWVRACRHVMALKTSQRRLYLHRQYFALSGSKPEYAPSRHMSLQAAQDICKERQRHDLPFDDKLDTINGILPAAIVLLLDAIYPLPTERTTYSHVIDRCYQVELLLSPVRATTYESSSQQLITTLAAVDTLLADTSQAAHAAELVRATWQPPPDDFALDSSFNSILEGLNFDSLLFNEHSLVARV